MKKKGLIISTVVMVIILIASLTTATYAWFTATSTASVQDVTFNVSSSNAVQIGIGTGTNQGNYRNGAVACTVGANEALTWSGGTVGLGSKIEPNFSWNISKAVGTVADGKTVQATGMTQEDVSTAYKKGNQLIAANGETVDGVTTLSNVAPAKINVTGDNESDVIWLQMGIRVAQENIYGTYAKVTVELPEGQDLVGMISAMRFEATVGTGDSAVSYSNLPFSQMDTPVVANDLTATVGRTFVFYFMIDELRSDAMNYKQSGTDAAIITEFTIRYFIDGYDTDNCNTDTTSYGGAVISLDFNGCDSATWTAESTWTKLTLE